jgi:hypothetical protein
MNYDSLISIHVDSMQKVIVQSAYYEVFRSIIKLSRFNTSGTPDVSFGENGEVEFSGRSSNYITSDSDGNILLELDGLARIIGYNIASTKSATNYSAFSIYPNPSSGFVTVKNSTSDRITSQILYDAYGNFIKVLDINSTVSLDQPPGIYFISIVSENKTITIPLVLTE